MCTVTGFNKYLCPCAKHDRPRAWLAKNFNPSLGWKNFTNLKQALGAAACRTVVHKVNIGGMKINNCLIGSSHCPSEIISIRQEDGTLFRAKLHYDSGASHCLANEFVKPIIIKQMRSPLPIQLSTINSTTCAIGTLATVEINDITFSCILVKNLHVDSCTMPIPRAWENYCDNWIEQEMTKTKCYHRSSLRSDRATLFPRPVLGLDNKVVETNTAHLLKSVVSGKF